MLLTEEQAREKQCRNVPPEEDGRNVVFHTCDASGCMMWRWALEKETDAFLDDVAAHMKANKTTFGQATQIVWAEKRGTYKNTQGYCGLAGTPRKGSD